MSILIALTVQTTLIAGAGSFSLTGRAAAFKHSLNAAKGTYSETGFSAIFKHSFRGARGTFSETGNSVGFGRKLTAAVGSYTETGFLIFFDRSMRASKGSFTVTGQNVAFHDQFHIIAGKGVFSVTGNAATLTHGIGYKITCRVGEIGYQSSSRYLGITRFLKRIAQPLTIEEYDRRIERYRHMPLGGFEHARHKQIGWGTDFRIRGSSARFPHKMAASVSPYIWTGRVATLITTYNTPPPTGIVAQYEPWRWNNSDGDFLDIILDSSGNGNTLGTSTLAKPVFKTGIVGGRAVVRFTGTTTGNACGAASGINAAFSAASTTHTLAAIWVPRDLTNSRQVAGWVGDNGSVATEVNSIHQDNVDFYQREGGSSTIAGGTPTVGSAVNVISLAAPSTVGELWVNGVQVGTHSYGSYGGGEEFSVAATWHHHEPLFNVLEMDLAALFVYDHPFDSGEITRWNGYSSVWYGV